jgi:energy-coupling factor transport system substrate-specific component
MMGSVSVRERILTLVVALISLGFFAWPFFIAPAAVQQTALAQTLFAALMPLLLALLAVEFSSGALNSRRLAVLGVLIALNAVVRMLGAGTAGIETVFFVIIIAAYVFGSGFGFLLGTGSLLVSALLTGGVGPWLPFQMMAAGLVGIGAGALPKLRSPRVTLIAYAILASFIYGGLMTLWNWPFLAGTDTAVSYIPGAGPLTNLQQFVKYELFTGGLLWDTGRALTTSVLIALTAPALITTLNRAATRAGFEKSARR